MRKIVASLLLPLVIACFAVFPQSIHAVNAVNENQAATSAVEAWDTLSDTWALTDALGRSAADYGEAGAYNANKKVGIFYSVWQDSLMEVAARVDSEAPRNITQIIKNNPDTWITDSALFGPASSMHYWGEPLYGYYNLSYDNWVVRVHAALLAEAGVDYIMMDMTNFYSSGQYQASESNIKTINNIAKVYRQMRAEGQKTPDIAMLFTWRPANCGQAVNWMYNNFIKDNMDLWFNYEGKPLIFGSSDYVDASIKDLFSYRSVAANYDATNSFQWLSNYPQSYVKDANGNAVVMTVSVAQNWTDQLACFTYVNEYGQFIGQGRSYTSEQKRLLTDPTSEQYHSEYGFNFQEQFNRALDIDPQMLIVTGWNEWIAARFYDALYPNAEGSGLPNYANFVDGFTTEFSRDIEMTKEGALKDNFYNQLVENMRLYKGVHSAPDYKQIKTVNMKSLDDWKNVTSYYRDTLGDNVNRDASGVGNLHYTDFSGRNDFVESKVCRDNEYVYFYAKCADEIKGMEDGNWMRLYIKTTGENGWEGYNYVINKDVPVFGKTTVYKLGGSWENATASGTAEVLCKGDEIAIAVKLSDLGLSAKNVSFQFKWHDNSQEDGNYMQVYTSGDCAPDARFNYVYTEDGNKVVSLGRESINDEDAEFAPMLLTSDDVIAHRFTAQSVFKGISLVAYNLNNKAASYTVSLYEWQDNYTKSVNASPLITKTYSNCYDESFLYLGANSIAKGTYLITVSDMSFAGDTSVGVYYCREQQTRGGLYLNGQGSSAMGLKGYIWYLDDSAVSPSQPEQGGCNSSIQSAEGGGVVIIVSIAFAALVVCGIIERKFGRANKYEK